jgi:hypothetical protein
VNGPTRTVYDRATTVDALATKLSGRKTILGERERFAAGRYGHPAFAKHSFPAPTCLF